MYRNGGSGVCNGSWDRRSGYGRKGERGLKRKKSSSTRVSKLTQLFCQSGGSPAISIEFPNMLRTSHHRQS